MSIQIHRLYHFKADIISARLHSISKTGFPVWIIQTKFLQREQPCCNLWPDRAFPQQLKLLSARLSPSCMKNCFLICEIPFMLWNLREGIPDTWGCDCPVLCGLHHGPSGLLPCTNPHDLQMTFPPSFLFVGVCLAVSLGRQQGLGFPGTEWISWRESWRWKWAGEVAALDLELASVWWRCSSGWQVQWEEVVEAVAWEKMEGEEGRWQAWEERDWHWWMGRAGREEATAGKLPSTQEGGLEGVVVLRERHTPGPLVVHTRGKSPLHPLPWRQDLDWVVEDLWGRRSAADQPGGGQGCRVGSKMGGRSLAACWRLENSRAGPRKAEVRQGSGAKEIEGRGCAPVEAVGSRCCTGTRTFLAEHNWILEICVKSIWNTIDNAIAQRVWSHKYLCHLVLFHCLQYGVILDILISIYLNVSNYENMFHFINNCAVCSVHLIHC